MMTLAFSLNRQTIIRTDRNRLVSGSRNYIYAKFKDVGGDWQPPITAIFSNYSTILDNEFTCVVPWEAIDQPGELVVSAFCGDLHTANEIVIPIENSGYTEGSAPSPPPTDIYNQITEMVQKAIDALEIAQNQADELIAIATENGVDILPDDIQSRIDRIEHILDAFLSAARESPILSAIIDKMEV